MFKKILFFFLAVTWGIDANPLVKRGIIDSLVGAGVDIFTTILPQSAPREGCRQMGWYNREPDGGKPIAASGGISGTVGIGLAQIGKHISSAAMREQCIINKFYDPNLDENGNPKNGGVQPGGMGGGNWGMGGYPGGQFPGGAWGMGGVAPGPQILQFQQPQPQRPTIVYTQRQPQPTQNYGDVIIRH